MPDVAVLFGKYLRSEGIVVDLVAGQTPGAGDPAAWSAGQVFLRRLAGGPTRRRLQIVGHALAHALRANRDCYDAIQVRNMPFVAAIVLLLARIKSLRFFYWKSFPISEGQILLARARGLSAGPMKFLYPFVSGHVGRLLMRHWVQPRADHVFVQSSRMQHDLEQQGVSGEHMTPVFMGVDFAALDALAPPPPPDPRLKGRRVIGYLGSLDRPRKVELLFPMLALVRTQLPDAVLLIVGDTDDEPHRLWLRDRATQAGVADAVIWTGWLPMRDGWQMIRQAEVALSMIPRSQLLDGASPTKVPEYLALGLPVVCNDNPDQEALIKVTGAGRCVPYTAEDFSAAVVELLALPAADRARMAQAGRQHVRSQRDYPRLAGFVAERYLALLREPG
jgi:glycosyltransferase involved in cell wall biosynthesis